MIYDMSIVIELSKRPSNGEEGRKGGGGVDRGAKCSNKAKQTLRPCTAAELVILACILSQF